MSRDIQWTDTDPTTGGRRIVSAEKFARKWHFKVKLHRRHEWTKTTAISRDMWETLLEALERRYPRREGVTDEDLDYVRGILAAWKDAPASDHDED